MDNTDINHSPLTDGATPPVIDILVAGLPGPLMGWTVDVLTRAATGRSLSVTHLPIAGEARWNPVDPASEPASPVPAARVFVGDFLQDAWADPIRNGHLAAVLVLDDVGPSWEKLSEIGQQPAEVRHNLVAVATSFGDVAGQHRVLVVTRSAWNDPDTLAARILRHAGLSVETSDALFAIIAGAGSTSAPCDFPAAASISDEYRKTIATIVMPAFAYARTGARLPVTWPRSCLYWGDSPGEALPRVLDLTGPSRILAYGPYLALPPGRWTMTTTLALSPASRGAVLSLGLYGAADLGRFEFQVDGPGLFKASIPVTVVSPREPLEIRLVTERGAIEGTIGIDEIAFRPA
jgi:hypothetical protein